MAKIFTCKELGGVCEMEFSGESLMEIITHAMPHMMIDDEHKDSILTLESRTGENQKQWFSRLQNEFESKS